MATIDRDSLVAGLMVGQQLRIGGMRRSQESVIVEELNVFANGTYTAPTGIAYNPVIVNVPISCNLPGDIISINNIPVITATFVAPTGIIFNTNNQSVTGGSFIAPNGIILEVD